MTHHCQGEADMRLVDRRTAIVASALLMGASLGLSACGPKGGVASADDMTLGDPKAPVTMVEYASVACPHCAAFNNTVWPEFKAKYVDTGKVYYVSREMLTGNASVAAAGFLLARCAGKDKYFNVTDAVYHAQDEIYSGDETNAPNARPVFLRIAAQAGISEPDFDKCVSDEAALKKLNDRSNKNGADNHVDSTPTFVINGKVIAVGEVTLEQLDKAVAEASKK
jgi:protein-disulfide isomerase